VADAQLGASSSGICWLVCGFRRCHNHNVMCRREGIERGELSEFFFFFLFQETSLRSIGKGKWKEIKTSIVYEKR
jgi:hypothetical protein